MIRSLIVATYCIVSTIAINGQGLEWKIVGALAEARHAHQAQVMIDGKIVVIGGMTGSTQYLDGALLDGMPVATVEVFDPIERTTEYLAPMNEARAEFASVVTRSGHLLVFGGLVGEPIQGKCTKKIEEYDPISDTWTVVGQLTWERRCHAALLIDSEHVLIVGGCWQDLLTTSAAEIYNLIDHSVTRIHELPQALKDGVLAMVQGVPTYIGGRQGGPNSPRQEKLYALDVATGAWSEQGPSGMPAVSSAVLLDDGTLIISGGAISEKPANFSSIVYRINNGRASKVVDTEQKRSVHAMAPMGNRTVLLTGGINNALEPIASTVIVDVETQSVLIQPDLVIARGYHTLVRTEHPSDGTTFYVISGMVDGQELTNTIEKLSIGTEASMIDRLTSVEENDLTSETFAYPNPVSDVLHVNADPNSLVRIVDVMGHVLMSFNTDKTGHATADVSSLPVGVLNVALKITESTENTQSTDTKKHRCHGHSPNNNKLVHLLKVAP